MRTKKKILSMLLTVCLIVGMLPQTAFATEGAQDSSVTIGTSGLCEHHTAHDETCGYVEGTEGTPCAHEHTEDCYEITESYTHTEACNPVMDSGVSDNSAPPSDAAEGAGLTACTGTDRTVGYAEGDVASGMVGETTTNYTSLDDALIAAQNNPGSTLREPQEIVQVDGADEDYEASVTTGAGTVNYEKLTEAIEAAKANRGATLKLLKDIDTNVCIDGGTFTFDLNGHTIEADTKFDAVAPYTNQFAMNILPGTDLTLIGSGSIISNGPTDPQYTTWLYCIRNQGTLTVNGPMQIRTNGYTYNSGIYSYGGTLTIHDCNIEVSRHAVEGNSGAQVTINGGSFTGDIGVYGGGNAAVNINGGTVTGSSYDVFISDDGGLTSVKLGIGSGGVSPSFPGGLSINNLVGISALLNPNYYYMKNGNPVDMTAITTEILDGDVSVGYCDHSSNTNGVPVADDDTHHSLFCSICEVKIRQEQHSLLGGICTDCGYGCSHPDVVTVNGVVKCAACPVVMVAQVGDSYYARLSDAVAQANAVNGSTLTLLSDVKGDLVVAPGSSFTLDLNGKTLRGTGGSVVTIGKAGEGGANLIMKSSGGGSKVTGCYYQNAQGTVVVNSWSTFTMESGAISGNVVYSGGGVYVAGGTFNMKGGEISGNTANRQGGGVYLAGESASFTMDGGAIRGNTVTVDDKNMIWEGLYGGGGVYVYSGTFTMNAGTISGNSSTYTRGGGVQVDQGIFVMNGGTIEGNFAAEKGGGVYVMKGENGNPSGTFTVDGSSVISGNTVNGSANNVYLAVPLTIGSNLSPDANIGVTGSTAPTETVGVEIASSGATDANKAAFISDNNAYSVIRTDNKLYLYLHIHNWVYELEGSDTIKATCHASDCSLRDGDGGSVRLVAQNAYYTGAPIGAMIEGSLTAGAVYKITYNDGSKTAPSTVGKHRATLTVTENGVQKQSVSTEYEILAEDSDTVKLEDIPEGGIPEGLWVAGVEDKVYTGKAVTQNLRVYDGRTRLRAGKDYTVSYKNNIKASQAADSGKSPEVVVKGKGNYRGTAEVFFKILPIDVNGPDVMVDDMTYAYNGKVQKKTPIVTWNGKKLSVKNDLIITYPDTSYMEAGIYNVVIEGKGNYTGKRTVQMMITDRTLITKAKVKKVPTQSYQNDTAVEPVLSVAMGNVPLEKDVDYEVTYRNNTTTGTATALVKGIGNYAGVKKVTFKIAGISLKKARIFGVEDKTYTGGKHQQNLSIFMGERLLEENRDYTISYTNNVNVGKATMTIKGIGGYSGTLKKSFKITAYDIELDRENMVNDVETDFTVKYEKGGTKPPVLLYFGNTEMIEGRDYTVTYKNNKVLSAQTNKTPSMVIKGKGNFKGNISCRFSIIDKELTDPTSPVSIAVADVVYSGKAGKYMSKPVLKDTNGKKLVAGKDYEKKIQYTLSDGTVLDKKYVASMGEVIFVTVTGKGNYTGTLQASYEIRQTSMKKAKIKITDQSYTGESINLDGTDMTVTINGRTLVYGQDYEIVNNSYTKNREKGKSTVIIRGLGEYAGEKKAVFKIVAKHMMFQRHGEFMIYLLSPVSNRTYR